MSEINVNASVNCCNENTQVPETVYHRKRKSTVFNRRSILLTDEGSIPVTSLCESERATSSKDESGEQAFDKNKEERFNLSAYCKNLVQERKRWKGTLKERRHLRRDLEKQITTLRHDECDLDLGTLSDSERAFVLARPNYEQICKNSEKLINVAIRISVSNGHIIKLYERFYSRVEEEIDRCKKRIIEVVD